MAATMHSNSSTTDGQTTQVAYIEPTHQIERKMSKIQPIHEIKVVQTFISQAKIRVGILLTIFGVLQAILSVYSEYLIGSEPIWIGLCVSLLSCTITETVFKNLETLFLHVKSFTSAIK